MVVALDKSFITVKDQNTLKENKVPALDPRWKTNMKFVTYSAPPLDISDKASVEEWAEKLSFIEDDLHELLTLKHDKFWCQIIFDDSITQCLDSYLRKAPRTYDVVYSLPSQLKEQHDKIHKLVFMTYLRMATHKESKENFFTPSVFGDILYENYLFDMAKLFDLAVLYGKENGSLLSKMIENVFQQQPKYNDDLQGAVTTILQVFDNILTKCGIQLACNSPLKLQVSQTTGDHLVSMSLAQFQDLLFYVSDTVRTMSAFLDVYPKAANVFMQFDFTHRLAWFYEQLVPKLHQAFADRDWPDTSKLAQLQHKLRDAQFHMLISYRQIVNSYFLQPLLEASCQQEPVAEYVEGYINAMMANLSERRFLAHIESLYPLADDIDMICQSAYSIDETRLEFLRDAVNEAFSMFGKHRPGTKRQSREQTQSVKQPDNGASVASAANQAPLGACGNQMTEATADELGACASRVTGIALDSLISSVKDLLPNISDGFIELCLEELDYSVEKVINAVLEDNLPSSLASIDRNMPREKKPIPEDEKLSTMLQHRQNVYDDDEFDMLKHSHVDMSRVHQGKKNKGLDANLLDDKSSIADLKPLYNLYGNEDKESMYDRNIDYDDEYDDTYDTNLVGAADADSADELTNRKAFVVPRVLQINRGEEEQESSDTEPEEAKNHDHFLQDPAMLREKRQRAQQARAAENPHPRKYNVAGTGQKGQGQSSDVVKNRRWKESNKSAKGNHNRRALADKKRKI